MHREMYDGKIDPWQRHNRCSAEQLKLVRKIADEEKYFEDKLTPDDFGRLQALFTMYSEVSEMDECEIYAYGFSVGLLIMQDVISVAKTILPDRCQHK